MTPARIVVVEDDRVVAMDIKQQVRRIGHEVVAMTARGEDVLPLVLEVRPDLVLMDIRVEGTLDGVDAAKRLREHCDLPVVFLTAYADDETLRRASLTEPFGYLLKPFEESQLRTAIEMALYKHAVERRLRQSERRFVATLSSIGDAVIATDQRALITFMNPIAERLTGWPLREAAGRHLAEVFRVVSEETRQPAEDPAAKVLRLGTIVGLANHSILIRRDGSELPIDDNGSPIVDDHGGTIGAVLVFRDISERRRVEESLRKAQADLTQVARLTTAGELAASIAHEVNQPLAAIVANAEASLGWLAKEPPVLDEARRTLIRVIRDGHHAGDVIRSIRAVINRTPPVMRQLDINAMIGEILALMAGELRRRRVSLETGFLSDVKPMLGDRVLLQQVMVNLIANGIEAMSDIEDRPRVLQVGTKVHEHGEVLVVVEDSGTGLDPATADRIFDALFTTKPNGMGMGLSISRSIVEAHGGRLWATSNSPHGSRFQFTLPTGSRADSDGAPG